MPISRQEQDKNQIIAWSAVIWFISIIILFITVPYIKKHKDDPSNSVQLEVEKNVFWRNVAIFFLVITSFILILSIIAYFQEKKGSGTSSEVANMLKDSAFYF